MRSEPRPAGGSEAPEVVFYDGDCGLCHRAVRFLLARDRDGGAFVFAPLFGETFEREIDEEVRGALPDSLVFRTHDGQIFVRSEAVLVAMLRLGGIYRLLALVARWVPRVVRDFLYDGIARIRHRLFSPPPSACPIVPIELRSRFLP